MKDSIFLLLRAAVLVAVVLMGAAALAGAGAAFAEAVGCRPTDHWYRGAYPIGNGRLGAMIFGGTEHRTLQLNDIPLWTGACTACPRIPAATILVPPNGSWKSAVCSKQTKPMSPFTSTVAEMFIPESRQHYSPAARTGNVLGRWLFCGLYARGDVEVDAS